MTSSAWGDVSASALREPRSSRPCDRNEGRSGLGPRALNRRLVLLRPADSCRPARAARTLALRNGPCGPCICPASEGRACPSWSAIWRADRPASSSRVATVLRKTCEVTHENGPASHLTRLGWPVDGG